MPGFWTLQIRKWEVAQSRLLKDVGRDLFSPELQCSGFRFEES